MRTNVNVDVINVLILHCVSIRRAINSLPTISKPYNGLRAADNALAQVQQGIESERRPVQALI